MEHDLQLMMSRLTQFGKLFETNARLVIADVYKDGIASRIEAETLLHLNRCLGLYADPLWARRLVSAMSTYILVTEAPHGVVNDDQADWLICQLGGNDGLQTTFGIDLLLHILHQAQTAPQHLLHHALEVVCEYIIAKGLATATGTKRLQAALVIASGRDDQQVGQNEVAILLRIHDSVASAPNHDSWNTLFARAVGGWLMACHPVGMRSGGQAQPGLPSAEYALLNERLSTNEAITPAERTLIAFLDYRAPDLVTALQTPPQKV